MKILAGVCRLGHSTIICWDQAFRGFAVNFFTDTKPDWFKSSINKCQDSNIIHFLTLIEQI